MPKKIPRVNVYKGGPACLLSLKIQCMIIVDTMSSNSNSYKAISIYLLIGSHKRANEVVEFKDKMKKSRRLKIGIGWRWDDGGLGIGTTNTEILYTLQTEREGVIVSWHYHFSVVTSATKQRKLQLELIKLLLHLLYINFVHIMNTIYIVSMHAYDPAQFTIKFRVYRFIRYTKNYFIMNRK